MKKTQSILIELLLVFFTLANLLIFSTAYGYYGSNTLFVIRVMPAERNLASQRIKAMGAEWAREEFNWQTLNPRRGRYDLANADQAVATYQRNGVKVLGMIAYSSLWGSSNPRAGTDSQFYKPNINDWKNYVSVLVHRYGGYVKDWEIWNEPDAMWRPSPNPDEYRDTLIAAYDTIKSIDPGARVGMGGMAYFDIGFISAVLDNGGWEHTDAVSVHYYPGVGPESAPGDTLRENLQNLVYSVLIPRGDNKEVWITEMGWESSRIGEEAQGEVISRAIILARMTNEVTKVIIYNLRDESGNSYGLMRNNFSPKPAYNYYKKTIEFLGSKRISQWFDLDNESKFYIFNDAGGGVAAAWNPSRNQITGFHVNASGMRCYDLAGQDVSGSVIMAWNNGDATLSFGPRPVFCQLDNYYLAEKDSNSQPQEANTAVAGVSTVNADIAENQSPQVSGTIQSNLSNTIDGKVLVYKNDNQKWQKFSEQATAGGSYNLQLPVGKYYLAYKIPGYLASNSQPFDVNNDSNIGLETRLFNSWIAYSILLGGIVVLILFILKYTRRKT